MIMRAMPMCASLGMKPSEEIGKMIRCVHDHPEALQWCMFSHGTHEPHVSESPSQHLLGKLDQLRMLLVGSTYPLAARPNILGYRGANVRKATCSSLTNGDT